MRVQILAGIRCPRTLYVRRRSDFKSAAVPQDRAAIGLCTASQGSNNHRKNNDLFSALNKITEYLALPANAGMAAQLLLRADMHPAARRRRIASNAKRFSRQHRRREGV